MSDFESFVPQRRFQEAVAVSRDGATVAYITNDGGQFNLWARSLAGGEAWRLTSFTDQSVRGVAWAPDGRSLVFMADRDGDEQYQLYVIDVGSDGRADGEPRRVTTADGRQHYLADVPFSPDGKLLFYAANDRDESVQDLLVHDLATGAVVRVESVPGELLFPFAPSPDGRWLLVAVARSNTDADCAVVDLGAATPTLNVLTAHDGERRYVPGDWLADSSGFLVSTNADSEFSWLGRSTLDGEITSLATPDWDVEAVHATEDGSTVVWMVNESGASVPVVHRGDAASTSDDWGEARTLPTSSRACSTPPR